MIQLFSCTLCLNKQEGQLEDKLEKIQNRGTRRLQDQCHHQQRTIIDLMGPIFQSLLRKQETCLEGILKQIQNQGTRRLED